MKDYYKTLGVDKNSSQEEIKRAYRKLAHEHHPDKNGGDDKKFKEINEAYQALGDEKKRAQYDRFGSTFDGRSGGNPFGGFDFNQGFGGFEFSQDGFSDLGDIFGNIFGGGSRSRTKTTKGADISAAVEISLEESAFGAKKEIEFVKTAVCGHCSGSRAEPKSGFKKCGHCDGSGKIKETHRVLFGVFENIKTCHACGGAGEIPEVKCSKCKGNGVLRKSEKIFFDIPRGINSDEIIKISGAGEAPRYSSGQIAKNGVSGDLYITIKIKPHHLFKRKGVDIYYDLPINFAQAVFGAKIEIPVLSDLKSQRHIVLKIPEGIESGEILRVKGGGMPYLNSYGSGDMYVKAIIKTPKKLSKRAKELLNELEGEL